MKITIGLLILFNAIFVTRVNSQVFLINLNESDFIFHENTLKAKDKACYVLNCLSENYVKHGSLSLTPLILFKVFDYTANEKLASKPPNAIDLNDYLKHTILPKLSLDMSLKGRHFEMSNSDPNFHTLDSLIVYDGKTYQLVKGGVSITEFFNTFPFKQLNLLQTNQSIFNIQSMIAPIYSWVLDSLPIPKVEEMIDGRIFLLKKKGEEYTFFRHAFDCSDCPLTFYNEYVYKKGFGVVAFKSKYLRLNENNEFRDPFDGKVIESDTYYYFK